MVFFYALDLAVFRQSCDFGVAGPPARISWPDPRSDMALRSGHFFEERAVEFVKMHGAGNDYVFCDGFASDLPQQPSMVAQQISNRHFGIGADGLVLMLPSADESMGSEGPDPDVCVRMWNSDGSEGSLCGNAVRCVAFWMKQTGRVDHRCCIRMGTLTIEADVSQVPANVCHSDEVRISLPGPSLVQGISVNLSEIASDLRTQIGGAFVGNELALVQVDCGNQHAVIFVDEVSSRLVKTVGPLVERHSRFPDRINVEFVQVQNRHSLKAGVWERGSGRTLACGSGACAAAIAAIFKGACDSDERVDVVLPGGVLSVGWNRPEPEVDLGATDRGLLTLQGPVSLSFEGIWHENR